MSEKSVWEQRCKWLASFIVRYRCGWVPGRMFEEELQKCLDDAIAVIPAEPEPVSANALVAEIERDFQERWGPGTVSNIGLAARMALARLQAARVAKPAPTTDPLRPGRTCWQCGAGSQCWNPAVAGIPPGTQGAPLHCLRCRKPIPPHFSVPYCSHECRAACGVQGVERGVSYPPPKLCRSLHEGGLDT